MINIQISEAEHEKPSTLRALALFLNTLAHERDGGVKRPTVAEHVLASLSEVPVSTAGNVPATGPDAAGASDDSSPEPDAAAPDDSSTSEALDAKGLPWDPRIHSSSKNKNSDGSWRYLRGVDKDLVGIVEAELRQLNANDDVPPPPAPVVEDAPPPPPPAPVVEDAPPPPPPAPVAAGVTMSEVFQRVTFLQKGTDTNRLPQDLLVECLSTVGLNTMGEFMKQSKADPALAGQLLEAINLVAGED